MCEVELREIGGIEVEDSNAAVVCSQERTRCSRENEGETLQPPLGSSQP